MKNEVSRKFFILMEEAKKLLDDDDFNADGYVEFAEKCCNYAGDNVYVARAHLKELRNLEASLRVTAKDPIDKLEAAARCSKVAILIAICDIYC